MFDHIRTREVEETLRESEAVLRMELETERQRYEAFRMEGTLRTSHIVGDKELEYLKQGLSSSDSDSNPPRLLNEN